MSVQILANSKVLGFGISAPFVATGGTGPYTYSVSGNGGTIDSNGLYTAPYKIGTDLIKATDSLGKTGVLQVFTGTPLHLLCDIIQKEMGLPEGRVYLWDQKVIMPTDYGLFVVVGETSVIPFGTTNRFDGANNSQVIASNFYAEASIDIYSRGPEARDRKEEIILALGSNYCETQQELNNFHIARISKQFSNLSMLEYDSGTAIPYRFTIGVGLQYQVKRISPSQYFDDFTEPGVTVNP